MRLLLALTVLLFGFNLLVPERDASTLLGDYLHASTGNAAPSLVEIEMSAARADRLTVAFMQPHEASDQSPKVEAAEPPPSAAPVSPDLDPERVPEVSLDDLCNALLTSAQENDLPVPFFANLIWQESRLRDDAVSSVGALGIAQFMPEVAMASGLNNPFDPLQAIPASARLLRELRDQFGNLGFVAAAYNAGAHRVSEWLAHRRALPRETLNYVVRVTGRSAEDWRKTPPDDGALTFVQHLPCRGLPAFADLEHAQSEEAQLEKVEAQLEEAEEQLAKIDTQPSQPSQGAAAPAPAGHRHLADRGHSRHEAMRSAARNLRTGRRQAEWREPREKFESTHRKRSTEVRVGMRTGAPRRMAIEKT
jgi:hypothetical protein